MLPRVYKNKSIKKTALAFVFLTLAVFLFLPIIKVQAQVIIEPPKEANDVFGLAPVENSIGLGNDDIRLIVARIIRAALGLLGVVAISFVIYAGYVIMISEGNEEKITQGKNILKNAVIGLAIILSAFSIASFIINSLATATGARTGGNVSRPPRISTFGGSGALGRVVRDHYPFRDQRNVPRNTRVVVTFATGIDPKSLITNTNRTCWSGNGPTTTCFTIDATPVLVVADTPLDKIANPYYGDCLTDKENFKFETDCDSAVTTSVKVYESVSSTGMIGAAALTSYDRDGYAKSFVFIPYQYLGSEEAPVKYTVYLTNNILQAGTKDGIFKNMFSQFYTWEFETGTELDFAPPYVVAVRPGEGENAKRSRLLQIYFSEPVDPTVAEGYFNSTDTAYFFSNIIINTSSSLPIAGRWQLGNGYTSAEFISDFPCGINSCGQVRFCLPVSASCSPTDKTCFESYQTLIKTADLLIPSNKTSFAAKPFTGIYDLAGNALNGDEQAENGNRVADGQPKETNGNSKKITAENSVSDNYLWSFDILNDIDKQAPYIKAITPDIDKDQVDGQTPVNISFNEVLRISSIKNESLKLVEYWGQKDEKEQFCFAKSCLDEFWAVPYGSLQGTTDKYTKVEIKHREFGPNDADFYYFPQIFSTLTDEDQNCFYPGRGPLKGSICHINYNEDTGLPSSVENCVIMENASSTADTACMLETGNSADKLQSDVNTCLNKIKGASEDATANSR